MVNFLEQMLGGTPGDPFLGTGLKDAISGGGGGLPSGLKAFFGDTGALSPKLAFGGTALRNNADLRRVLGLPAPTPPGAASPQQAQRLAVAAGIAPATPPATPAAAAPAAPGTAGFIEQQLPYAQAAVQQAGATLDPAIAVAVAANETGYGTTGGTPWNSLHGIRGVGPAGQTPGGFRAYATPQESYADFVRLVTDPNGRYAPAYQGYQQSRDAARFIQDIAAAGYALAGPEAQAWVPQVQSIYQQVQNNQPWVAPTVAAATSSATPFAGAPFEVRFGFDQPYGTPLAGGTTHHRGVDIVPVGGGIGAPVTALRPGTVVAFQQGGEQGNAVVLQADDGLYHAYFHLLDPNRLAPGTRVEAGQQINRMGQSGSEGFPHLHLEVRRRINGDPRGAVINPLTYFGLGQ